MLICIYEITICIHVSIYLSSQPSMCEINKWVSFLQGAHYNFQFFYYYLLLDWTQSQLPVSLLFIRLDSLIA